MLPAASSLLLAASGWFGGALGWTHATEASFRKALRSNDYTLVAFVDPSQAASAALEPEWTSIQETERDNNVISLDCGAKRKICDELDVASYPAIRLYHKDSRITRFRGPRKASAIVPFLRRALRPAVSRIDDIHYASFVAVDDVVFVAHVAPGDTVLERRFEALARQMRDRYTFAFGNAPQGTQSAVACFNNRDDESQTTVDLEAIDALDRFVDRCAKPLIVELTRRNEMENMNSGRSLVHYFTTPQFGSRREQYEREIRPLAKKYREYLQFTVIDADEYPDMMPALGLPSAATSSGKALSVQNPGNGDVFPFPFEQGEGKDITAGIVEAFLLDIINGKVQPFGMGGSASASTGSGGSGGDQRREHEEL